MNAQPPIFILFWIPQKVPTYTPVNQVTQKNTCQIFPPKKNPGNENFKPPKILLSSKVPPGEL